MKRIASLALRWGTLFGIGMIVRTLFDAYAPPSPNGYGPRSAMTTWFAVATFFFAGASAAYRSRQAGGGVLVAIVASVVGHALAIMATLVLFLAVIRHDSEMLRTFEMTGGWDEALFLPIVLIPIVAAIGLVGGLVASISERVFSRGGERI